MQRPISTHWHILNIVRIYEAHMRSTITYPNAKVLQSAAGAIEHNGSNIVRADIDSDLLGSNKITFPIESPARRNSQLAYVTQHQLFHENKNMNPPKAKFPFFIQAADLSPSNEEYLAIS